MLLFREFLAVACGGAFGAVGRFGLSRWIQQVLPSDFPWGILLCNVLGSLLIGILAAWLLDRGGLSPLWRAGLMVGLLGGFTTFSSFSLDSVTLLQSGAVTAAFANILLSLVCCLAATAVGFMAVRSIF